MSMLTIIGGNREDRGTAEILELYQNGLIGRDRLLGVLKSLQNIFSPGRAILSSEDDEMVRAYFDQLARAQAENEKEPFSTHQELRAMQLFLGTQESTSLSEIKKILKDWRLTVYSHLLTLYDIGNWVFQHEKSLFPRTETARPLPKIEKTYELRLLNLRILLLEMLLKKTRPQAIPPLFVIDPTASCNFRCHLCAQSTAQDHLHLSLSPVTIKKLEPLLPYVSNASLYGTGEPTLSPFLQDLIDITTTAGCTTSLLTNGSTLGKRNLDFSNLTTLGISFDGAERRTMETLRVGSNFNSMLKRIRELVEENPELPVTFNSTISRANIDEMAGIVRIAGELGVREVAFNKILPYMEKLKPLSLRRSDEQIFNRYLEEALEVGRAFGVVVRNCISLEYEIDDQEPLDKEALFTYLDGLETAGVHKPLALSALLNRVSTMPFSIQPPGLLPSSYFETVTSSPTEPSPDSIRINSEYHDQLVAELQNTDPKDISIPYCTSPWVKVFIEAHGGIRPCCVWNGDIASLHTSKNFQEAWYSEDLVMLRKATVEQAPIPKQCSQCTFVEKYQYFDDLMDLLAELGIDPKAVSMPEQHYSLRELWKDKNPSNQSGQILEEAPVTPAPRIVSEDEVLEIASRELGRETVDFYYQQGQLLPQEAPAVMIGLKSPYPAMVMALGARRSGNSTSPIVCVNEWINGNDTDKNSFLNFLSRLEEARLDGSITPLHMAPHRALSYFSEKSIDTLYVFHDAATPQSMPEVFDWSACSRRLFIQCPDTIALESAAIALSGAHQSIRSVILTPITSLAEVIIERRVSEDAPTP